jgi:hypothetical protein
VSAHVWVSVTSHRASAKLRRLVGDDLGPAYGSWPTGSNGMRGNYYHVNERYAAAIGRIPGLRVLQAEPKALMKRWGQ